MKRSTNRSCGSAVSRAVLGAVLGAAAVVGMAAPAHAAPPESLAKQLRAQATRTPWVLNDETGKIGFISEVRLMSSVTGQFEEFDSIIATDPQGRLVLSTELDVNSLETNQHRCMVLSEDFFNAAEYDRVRYHGFVDIRDGDQPDQAKAVIDGELLVRGVTRPTKLVLNLKCPEYPACMQTGLVTDGQMEIDRSEFGMTALSAFVKNKITIPIEGRTVPMTEAMQKARANIVN